MIRIPFSIVRLGLLAVSIILLSTHTKAQYLSLNKNELRKLIILIKTDPQAKKQYEILERLADKSLNEAPNPIDTIISEGHLADDPKKINTQKSLKDINKIYALAYTYKVSGAPQYLKKCVDYLISWAKVNRGLGNPINDTKLDFLIESYDLIKEDMNATDRKIVAAWFTQLAKAEIESLRLKAGKMTSYNNWNSHRIKIIGEIAYAIDDQAFKQFTDTALKAQISKNLYADGSGVDFKERDALHYHNYTLDPLLKIAIVVKRATAINYFSYVSPVGSSIQKSVEFLVPFASGEKTHKEFVNSKVAFDKKRANNNEPGFFIGEDFEPKKAIGVLSYAAYFNSKYNDLIKKVLGTTNSFSNWQLVLNAARD